MIKLIDLTKHSQFIKKSVVTLVNCRTIFFLLAVLILALFLRKNVRLLCWFTWWFDDFHDDWDNWMSDVKGREVHARSGHIERSLGDKYLDRPFSHHKVNFVLFPAPKMHFNANSIHSNFLTTSSHCFCCCCLFIFIASVF